MRGLIYARVSGDDRGSLATQLEMGRAYAVERGHTIVAELAEEWVSGASMDAPELQRLLEMARAGAFDVLIVREMDRLARDLVKQMIVEGELKRAGVAIEYVLGEYPETPEGTLNKQIRAVISEYERQKITERSIRGRRASAKAGNVLGRAPYGYCYTEDGLHLEPIESEANVIRMIYTWYTQGNGTGEPLSSEQIAAKLTALQVPTWADLHEGISKTSPFGAWGAKRVLAILHNETYSGTHYFGRSNNGVINPPEQWIPIPVPAIVTQATWDAAQLQCQRNWSRPPVPAQHNYLLQGHVTCGECGHTAYAVADTHNKARPYRYYRCGANIKRGRGSCVLPGIRVETIDQPAWEWIMALILDQERLDAGLEALQGNPAWDNPTRQRYDEAQQRQVTYSAQRDRLLDLYLTGNIDKATYLARHTTIERELQKAIQEQVAIVDACERAQPPTDNELSDARAFAQAIREELQDASFTTQRRIIAAMDVRAWLYQDRRGVVEVGIPSDGRYDKYISGA